MKYLLCVTEGEYKQKHGIVQRNGTGTHYLPPGIVYQGQWVDDKMTGRGTAQKWELILANDEWYLS